MSPVVHLQHDRPPHYANAGQERVPVGAVRGQLHGRQRERDRAHGLKFKYFRAGFKKGHVIGTRTLARFITGYAGKNPPPFSRFYMGGENDIRGFDIWGISPIAYVPSEASVPLLNADGSARQQKVI